MPQVPLLGYNNNVRHRGRIFHIQTEDSGAASPRIMTHLFADGGRIVRSIRTDYSEHLGLADVRAVVKDMMKEQHKRMFVSLRSGQLDDLIGFDSERAPASDNATTLGQAEALVESQSASVQAAHAQAASVAPPPPGVTMTSTEIAWAESPPRSYAASRPASIFSTPPRKPPNIFGEISINEKSLDDAILSYLAEEEEAGAADGSR